MKRDPLQETSCFMDRRGLRGESYYNYSKEIFGELFEKSERVGMTLRNAWEATNTDRERGFRIVLETT